MTEKLNVKLSRPTNIPTITEDNNNNLLNNTKPTYKLDTVSNKSSARKFSLTTSLIHYQAIQQRKIA